MRFCLGHIGRFVAKAVLPVLSLHALTETQVVAGTEIAGRQSEDPKDRGASSRVQSTGPDVSAGSGTWATTGSLTSARYGHTATLLSNGKVIVVGGQNGSSSALGTTELYNPGNGNWKVAGDLITARMGHTATLLSNGTVLVAGGWDGVNCLDSAELFNSETGTWARAGSLNSARQFHTATLLPSGKTLVVGGISGSSNSRGAELYDPTTHSWSTTGSLSAPRYGHTATLLKSGKVLVAGGYDTERLKSAELFDPAAGTWTRVGDLALSRSFHSGTLLSDGKVLVAGSVTGIASSSAEVFDPETATWTVTGSLAESRPGLSLTMLTNGAVLAAGGAGDASGPALKSAELYDAGPGTWSGTGSLRGARASHTATLLNSGQVLVAGGSVGFALDTAELYDSPPPSCSPDDATLCLLNGRFRVTADYGDYGGNHGIGHAQSLTSDTGYFWFFTSSNVEVVVKMVPSCNGSSGNVSVYAGGLTDLDVTLHVTDTRTTETTNYSNPLGTGFRLVRDGPFGCPAGATSGDVALASIPALPLALATGSTSFARPQPLAACVADGQTLCLLNGRFQVKASYTDYSDKTGTGQAVSITPDTASFWFFSSANLEVVIKMVPSCADGSSTVGVYATGLTDVGVTLTVTDTQTGLVKTYSNALGHPFDLIRDGSFVCIGGAAQ